jgi:hypothetical protein
VSASTKIRRSPDAARAPSLRVFAICRLLTLTTFAPPCRASSAVASLEASSATTIS